MSIAALGGRIASLVRGVTGGAGASAMGGGGAVGAAARATVPKAAAGVDELAMLRNQPQQLLGRPVSVLRSSGATDHDWTVTAVGQRPGTMIVAHASHGWRTLSVDEVIRGLHTAPGRVTRGTDAGVDLAGLQRQRAAALAPRGFVERPSWMTPQFVERMGRVAQPTTQRGTERMGILPGSVVHRLRAGEALDVSRLDPGQRYLWVVDTKGAFRFAPEQQLGRTLKHGNLVETSAQGGRGWARTGGELYVGRDGRWHLDNNSSYVFARMRDDAQFAGFTRDGRPLVQAPDGRRFTFDPANGAVDGANVQLRQAPQSADSLYAVGELLGRSGTDMSRIVLDDVLRAYR